MPSRIHVPYIASFIVWVILIAAVTPAWGESKILRKGEPAPYDGLLLDEAAATQAAVDVQRKDALESEIETARSVIDSQRGALDAADKREEIHLSIEERMKAALDMNTRAAETMSKAADIAIRAAEKSQAALDKAEEKIEAANKRSFWGTVAAFVVGILIHAVIP